MMQKEKTEKCNLLTLYKESDTQRSGPFPLCGHMISYEIKLNDVRSLTTVLLCTTTNIAIILLLYLTCPNTLIVGLIDRKFCIHAH